jgi:hypothetical protein
MSNSHVGVVVAITLLIGSAATLIPSALLSSPCPSNCGTRVTLDAPVFAGLIVFLASSLGLLIQALNERSFFCSRAKHYGTILPAGVFAAVGTLLQLCALLYIPAAVLAGLRGFFIGGTAIVSARMRLKDAPGSTREWFAVIAAVIGALGVGAAAASAAFFYPSTTNDGEGGAKTAGVNAVLLGVAFSLSGYAVATAQVAFEQHYMESLSFGRWEILGVEGLVASSICGITLAALASRGGGGGGGDANNNFLDDSNHTYCCLRDGGAAPITLALAYGAASLSFNALLLLIAGTHGPNLRVFVFTARGVLTWIVEIIAAANGFPGGVGRGSSLTLFAILEAASWVALISGGVLRVVWQSEREQQEAAERENNDDDDDAVLGKRLLLQ